MRNWLSNCRKGFANIVRWMPLVWGDRDYHYGPLLDVMHFKLCNMADYHEHHGHLVNNGRYARQMRLCAEICLRLSEDNYLELVAPLGGEPASRSERTREDIMRRWNAAGLQRHRDQQRLASMLGTSLLNWWD